jgi:hypothetical protein
MFTRVSLGFGGLDDCLEAVLPANTGNWFVLVEKS